MLRKVTESEDLAAQTVTKNHNKKIRESIKNIGEYNLHSYISSKKQNITLSDKT